MAPGDLLYIAAVTAFLFWISEIVFWISKIVSHLFWISEIVSLDIQNTYFGYTE